MAHTAIGLCVGSGRTLAQTGVVICLAHAHFCFFFLCFFLLRWFHVCRCAAILAIEFRRIGLAAADLDPVSLSSRCVGLSGAEISALCREAALVAMEEDIHAQKLTHAHFDVAFARITPRITPAMLQFYANYAAKSSVASV